VYAIERGGGPSGCQPILGGDPTSADAVYEVTLKSETEGQKPVVGLHERGVGGVACKPASSRLLAALQGMQMVPQPLQPVQRQQDTLEGQELQGVQGGGEAGPHSPGGAHSSSSGSQQQHRPAETRYN